MRIIVADDVPLHVREIAEAIRGNWPRWEVLTAGDGREILDLVAAQRVDVVLSDIRMPKMDGLEMLSRVRVISPLTRIVFITAYPLFEYAQKALKLGATDFLLKPVDMGALFDLLSRLSNENGREGERDEDIRRWLDAPWQSAPPEFHERIRTAFPRGRICAVIAPADDAFPQPSRLAEMLADAAGVSVYGGDMGSTADVRRCALVCLGEQGDCDGFLRALREAALRYSFRAGTAPWSARLADEGYELWRAALGGAGDAFYQSAAIVERSGAAGAGSVEMPGVSMLLKWFSAPGGWRDPLEDFLKIVAREKPEPETLIRQTRGLLETCAQRFALGGADAPIGAELGLVVFFNEYRTCLETALAALETRYRRGVDALDPVEMAKAYVQQHYMEPISLAGMAGLTGLSPNYFSTLFRKSTSMRFMEYVLQVRLEKASQMLANTDMYVYEIASACGYDDVRYFVRVYQKTYGMSPASFRRCFRADRPE